MFIPGSISSGVASDEEEVPAACCACDGSVWRRGLPRSAFWRELALGVFWRESCAPPGPRGGMATTTCAAAFGSEKGEEYRDNHPLIYITMSYLFTFTVT